jgi:glycosyltransferase involved in cell wall biosynthesis
MKDISIVCPINNLGYGISSYNIWKNLRTLCKTSLFPIGNISIESHWDKEIIIKDIKNQINYNKDSACLKIWHPNDLLMKPHGYGPYATYSFFEINKISIVDRVGYNISDIIITPTSWAKNVLIDNGIDQRKIKVSTPGVDLSIFDHELSIEEEEKTEDYVFLNIGKWETRKGHDILVHLFNQAFNQDDNVRLLMINTNPFLSDKENQQWQNLYKNSKLGNKIYILPRVASQKDIAKIIKISDCGIYPARAEGWNNEAIETMAMNKPIILTNYSAHTEYANKTNSYLIDINSLESANDGKFFNGEAEWGRLDNSSIEQGVEHMRYVYNNRITTNPQGLITAQNYSWTKTANSIIENIYG